MINIKNGSHLFSMNSPWDIKKKDFPENGNLSDKIKFILGYAVLAPSTHNSQPWLFKIESNSCKIYYDKSLKIPEADPVGRDLYISMGCVVENLVVAASYFGMFKDLKVILDDSLIAEVYFQEKGERNLDLNYFVDTIPRRVNARGLFESNSLPESIQAEILSLKKDGRIRIDFITNKEKIKKLAAVTVDGLRLAYKKPAFRKEMSGWMQNSLSGKKIGLPGYSLRVPFILSFIIPTLVRFFDISPLLAKLNYKSMASAPFICLFSSEESNPSVWFEVGRMTQRCMLHLNSKDIRTSIFVASIEMGDLYRRVQEVAGISLRPQFLFCAGCMKDVQKHSPRRSLEDKLI